MKTKAAVALAVLGALNVSGCANIPAAARPGLWAAGAVIGASLLLYAGEKRDSSNPSSDVGCFDRIDGGHRDTICPP
jgi:hypothetical protein